MMKYFTDHKTVYIMYQDFTERALSWFYMSPEEEEHVKQFDWYKICEVSGANDGEDQWKGAYEDMIDDLRAVLTEG